MRQFGQVWGAKFRASALLSLAVLLAPAAAQAHTLYHHHLRRETRTVYHRHYAVHSEHHYYAMRHVAEDSVVGPTSIDPSMILIDAGTGRVISEDGADIPRYPASLTKLMTLDLAFEALRDGKLTLDTRIPVSEHAASVEPVKLGLRPGSTITVRDAILAMTTMSANDAATALGEYLGGGSEARCAQMMTLRAHALGMAQTEFTNASGLPNPDQITTARDLSILARDIVVGYPEDQHFFEVQKFYFDGRPVYSNNEMLKIYPGTTGMKTGYTFLARHNLIVSAVRDGEVLIGVELHEPSWGVTYQQMTAMLNAGFADYAENTQHGASVALAANTPAPAAPTPPPARPADIQEASWTARLGLFKRMSPARVEAINVQRLQGSGIAQVARVERYGKTFWSAELAGLTLSAAFETCDAVQARGDSCRVLVHPDDHLAMGGPVSNPGT